MAQAGTRTETASGGLLGQVTGIGKDIFEGIKNLF
jgi:hypothetical protein